MTQQEFYSRTGVEVDANEFWAIHETYCLSALNKDEFCLVWCKMNRPRVLQARQERKERAEMQVAIGRALKLFDRLYYIVNCERKGYSVRVGEVATKTQLQALRKLGIQTYYYCTDSEGTQWCGTVFQNLCDKMAKLNQNNN